MHLCSHTTHTLTLTEGLKLPDAPTANTWERDERLSLSQQAAKDGSLKLHPPTFSSTMDTCAVTTFPRAYPQQHPRPSCQKRWKCCRFSHPRLFQTPLHPSPSRLPLRSMLSSNLDSHQSPPLPPPSLLADPQVTFFSFIPHLSLPFPPLRTGELQRLLGLAPGAPCLANLPPGPPADINSPNATTPSPPPPKTCM